MTWKHVLNPYNKPWGTIDEFFEFAKESGYEFFDWNGQIYFINIKDNEYIKTKLTVNDLGK